jgi:uncharacterized protein YdeI (YjbR/CyaY-like superfamily)
MKPRYFKSAADFRRWLEKHHATATEFLVGFYNKASGKGGLTYQEAVDEMLCFGWIDGVVRRVDNESYSHRVTPRRPGSIWSQVNVSHVQRLRREGKMHPSGLRVFANRQERKTGIYAYEQRPEKFPKKLGQIFRAQTKAWAFFKSQPPGYRRTAIYWVSSAKQLDTRLRRLQKLITSSASARRLI